MSGSPSQSNQLYAHESMWQVPLTHDDEAKLFEHMVPHFPQLLKLVWRLTHTFPHNVVPAGQPPHVPLLHAAPVGHLVVHEPQWFGSLDTFTHAPPQLVCPDGHCDMHVPFAHTDPEGQTAPHAPQFCGSLTRLTQAPAHTVCPAGHWLVHCPDAQA